MLTSESIAAIAAALSKAQGAMSGALKDRQNPHYKSDYATLASVIDAARTALATNGLSVFQGLSAAPNALVVTTRLMHSSGEWIEDTLAVPLGKADAQGMGSAATYGRRYALAAALGIAQVDDDGNAASERPTVEIVKPAPDAKALQAMRDAAMQGTESLKSAWKALTKAQRDGLAGELAALKEAAVKADEPVAA